jgi:Icc-related predicted phosphoesterase
MKIIAISDTHSKHRELTEDIKKLGPVDVLIHAGDITAKGELSTLNDFNQWCLELKRLGLVKEIIATFGNHELKDHFKNTPTGLQQRESAKDYILLLDEEYVYDGVKFYGCPWTRRFFNWQYMIDSDNQAHEIYKKIPKDVDVLIVHGPPYGILDEVSRLQWSAEAGCTVSAIEYTGCKTIIEYIEKIQPMYYICGHIHEQYGLLNKSSSQTKFINASSLDDKYQYTHKPIVFELHK